MHGKMKVAVMNGIGQMGFIERDIPTPGPDEVLVKLEYVGICGSDICAFRGTNVQVSYPRVIGHELAGIVESIPADNKKGLKVGDRVVVDPYLYCGHCYPCSIGRTNGTSPTIRLSGIPHRPSSVHPRSRCKKAVSRLSERVCAVTMTGSIP